MTIETAWRAAVGPLLAAVQALLLAGLLAGCGEPEPDATTIKPPTVKPPPRKPTEPELWTAAYDRLRAVAPTFSASVLGASPAATGADHPPGWPDLRGGRVVKMRAPGRGGKQSGKVNVWAVPSEANEPLPATLTAVTDEGGGTGEPAAYVGTNLQYHWFVEAQGDGQTANVVKAGLKKELDLRQPPPPPGAALLPPAFDKLQAAAPRAGLTVNILKEQVGASELPPGFGLKGYRLKVGQGPEDYRLWLIPLEGERLREPAESDERTARILGTGHGFTWLADPGIGAAGEELSKALELAPLAPPAPPAPAPAPDAPPAPPPAPAPAPAAPQ